jgi:TatD DNase family protein
LINQTIPHQEVLHYRYIVFETKQHMQLATSRIKMSSLSVASAAAAPLIDIGCNLLDPMFRGEYRGKQQHDSDFPLILQRGWEQNVQKVIITAGTLQETKDALALARTDPRLYSTVGVHPTRCKDEFVSEEAGTTYLQELVEIAKIGKQEGKIVAVGECGLDYDRIEFCPKDVQKKWFERQLISLAAQVDLPLFLHCRAAGDDMVETLREHGISSGVIHSFDGSMETMRAMCSLGLSIGINGCSLRTEENLAVVKEIPVDKLLLETDGPWCDIRSTHPGHQFVQTIFPTVKKPKKFVSGKCVKNRQEICHLRQVLEVVAGVRGVPVNDLAEQVYQNTLNVFPGLSEEQNTTAVGSNSGEAKTKSGGGSGGRGGKGSGGGGGMHTCSDENTVTPFSVDEDFDYDSVKLSGRKQTRDGWTEYATEDTYNDYLASVGGDEAVLAKKLAGSTQTTKTSVK